MAGDTHNSLQRLKHAAMLCALGFFSIIVQTVLFRSYMTVFEGNELSISFFFASWLVWVAAGAALARLRYSGIRSIASAFDVAPLIYIPAFILQYWLITRARSILGIEHFEQFPIARMILLTTLINAPVSACTGFLFSLACEWIKHNDSVAEVYTWEAAGSLAGGVAATLMFYAGCSSESVILYTGLLLAIASMAVTFGKRRSAIPGVLLIILVLILTLRLDVLLEKQDKIKRWTRIAPREGYQGYFRTPQADYIYGEFNGQFNVLAWDTVEETVPNTEQAAEIVATVLPQNPQASRFLVLGHNALSLCNLINTLPQTKQVTWVHTDPAYAKQLLKHLPPAQYKGVEKITIPNVDPLKYMSRTKEKYDIIINCMPDATTLAINRYCTREAFITARNCLTPSGLFAIRLTGGENYLGGELLNAGATIYATLHKVFDSITLRSGDNTWMLAANNRELTSSPEVLRDRFSVIPGAAAIYPPNAFLSLYLPGRTESQLKLYRKTSESLPDSLLINTEKRPRSLFHNLLLLLKQAGLSSHWTATARNVALRGFWLFPIALVIFVITRLAYLLRMPSAGSRGSGFDSFFLLASTGAAAMASSIMLILAYQYQHGSVFLDIGLISAAFMGGIVIGSRFIRFLPPSRPELIRPSLIFAIILHSAFLILLAISNYAYPKWAFIMIIALAGAFSGTYFPLLARQMKSTELNNRSAGSFLEAADHLGGAFGGLFFGLFCTPLFGIPASFIFAAALLLSAVLPLLMPRTISERRSHPAHIIGCIAFAVGAFTIVSSTILYQPEQAPELQSSVLRSSEKNGTEKTVTINGRDCRYLEIKDSKGKPEAYLFDTDEVIAPVRGYSGPTVLRLRLSAEGVLEDFQVIRSGDTPGYLGAAVSAARKMIGADFLNPGPVRQYDGVTGATISYTAISRNIALASRAFASQVIGHSEKAGTEPQEEASNTPWLDIGIIATAVAVVLYMRRRPKRIPRYAMLGAVVLIFGFWRAFQLALPHLFALFSLNGISPQSGTAFIAAVLIPLVIVCLGNIYCGWLCPFGALQELVGLIRPAHIQTDPHKAVLRYGRMMKYLILFVAVIIFACSRNSEVPSNDQLSNFFGTSATRKWSWILVSCLIASIPYRRFWCRNLCPVGALLSLLNRIRFLRFMIPRVAPAFCDLGVEEKDELDCICCDRCRSRPLVKAACKKSSPSSTIILNGIFCTAVIAGTIAMLIALTSPLRETVPEQKGAISQPALDIESGVTGLERARNVDMDELTSKIKRRRLSDHEAMYYTTEH